MSQAVVWNGQMVTSAQVASDFTLDAEGQTRQIMDKIDALLAQAGMTKRNVISANIWLSDIVHYQAMNTVWDAWIDPACPPVRACVEARFSSPKILVEIQVLAAT
ncbi:MAG: RidA family protein [Beijerinckiaceae bacterium]|nr:RidA family protein [Beijerinckiaceae bacterium]